VRKVPAGSCAWRYLDSRALASSAANPQAAKDKKEKKVRRQDGLTAWLWDQVLHIWHGFRLLGVNVGITLRLRRQMHKGQKLTRRERQLLEQTTRDLLRLVPFSVFIIVPGGELLLPVALAMFPNLMPSTFDTTDSRRRQKIMENLQTGIARRRLFEHMTMRVLHCENFKADSKSLEVFRACVTGSQVTEEAIKSFVPYFEDTGPLALKKLPFYVLTDLCVLDRIISRSNVRLQSVFLPQSWIEVRLRVRLGQKLEQDLEDDRCLALTDMKSLTHQELEAECARRKMRWIGPAKALRNQLTQWLSLSLDPDVPPHLLLFLYPCATDSDVMMSCLSKNEQDHILGLAKFRDTPTYQLLRSVTQSAAAKSQAEIHDGLMDEDIDIMKSHIEKIKQEDQATAAEFAEIREALKDISDDEVLQGFDALAEKKGTSLAQR